MTTDFHRNISKGALALACAAIAFGTLAVPASAQPQDPPSYAVRGGDEQIHGTVAAVNGKYSISVRDARGFIDNVTLHDGTIINPRGLTLAPGQRVSIFGRAQGPAFAANEIDTPYRSIGFPAYAYGYGPYPYGPYPYGPYGYGPYGGVGIGFGFGFRGRW